MSDAPEENDDRSKARQLPSGAGMLGLVALALPAVAFFVYQRDNGLWFLPPLVASIAVVGAGMYLGACRQASSSVFSVEEAEAFRKAKDPELAQATALQRSAVVQHARRLADEMAALKRRAGVAYMVGIVLCVFAVIAGPVLAYMLATQHPEHWQYIFGGSALALIALAAATALLRHDTKLQDQIAAANRELHYFQRVETGLDCAFTLQNLNESPYRTSLERVVQHLLTPPPSLEMPSATEVERDGKHKKGKAPDKDGKQSDGKAEDLTDQAAELFKQVLKSSAKS